MLQHLASRFFQEGRLIGPNRGLNRVLTPNSYPTGMVTPTQAQAIAQNRKEVRRLRGRRYRNLVGMGFGGAGLAVAFAGLPIGVTLILWAGGFAAWAILKNA